MPIPLQNHYQNAYITPDIDRALAMFRTRYGFDGFRAMEVQFEVRKPTGPETVRVKLALGWMNNLQFELIQPLSGLEDFYGYKAPNQPLLRFHHTAMRVPDWDQFHAGCDQPIIFSGGTPGHLQFAFVDARETLGHYLEYCWMTAERWAAMGGS